MASVHYNNAHCLAAIAQASAALTVVAAEDINDGSGAKLVARGQKVPPELQARLAERSLAKPLEASLAAEDGVTGSDLEQEAMKLCQNSAFLAAVIGRDFGQLRQLYRAVPLHPFIRLLLTTEKLVRPKLFSHAVLGSVLAGALVLKLKEPLVNAQLALLAGLLHDIGELYASPGVFDAGGRINPGQWQEIAGHAETGCRVIEQFSDCPRSVSQAVYQHHERLDGSGYPRGISGDQLTPLGRLLSLVETVCGILNAPDNHGARVKLAVTFISGEYEPQFQRALITALSGTFAAEIALPPSFDAGRARKQAGIMSACLRKAHDSIASLTSARIDDESMETLMQQTYHRIEKLKSSWDATGIDQYFAAGSAPAPGSAEYEEAYFDLDVVTRELMWRMRSLARQVGLTLHQRRLTGFGALEPVVSALEVRT